MNHTINRINTTVNEIDSRLSDEMRTLVRKGIDKVKVEYKLKDTGNKTNK